MLVESGEQLAVSGGISGELVGSGGSGGSGGGVGGGGGCNINGSHTHTIH